MKRMHGGGDSDDFAEGNRLANTSFPFLRRSEIQSVQQKELKGKAFTAIAVKVPGTGLEPAHQKALDPKSSVSTNSTTPAFVWQLTCHEELR